LEVKEDSSDLSHSKKSKQIVIEALRAAKGSVTPLWLAKRTGLNRNTVRRDLQELVQATLAQKLTRGAYTAVASAEQTLATRPQDSATLKVLSAGSRDPVAEVTYSTTNPPLPSLERPVQILTPPNLDWAKKLDISEYLTETRKKRYGDKAEPICRDWMNDGWKDGSIRQLAYKNDIPSPPTILDLLIDITEHAVDPLLASRVLGAKFSGRLLVDGKVIRLIREGQKKEKRTILTLVDAVTTHRFMRRLIPVEAEPYITPIFQEFKLAYREPDAIVQDFSLAISASRESVFPNSIPVGDQFHQMQIIEKRFGKRGRNRIQWHFWALARGFVDAGKIETAKFYWNEIENSWRYQWLDDPKCLENLKSLEDHYELLMNRFRVPELKDFSYQSNGIHEYLNKPLQRFQTKLGGAFHNENNAVGFLNMLTAFEETLTYTSGHLQGYSPLTKQGYPKDIDFLALALNAGKFIKH